MWSIIKEIIFTLLPEKYKENKHVKLVIRISLLLIILISGLLVWKWDSIACMILNPSFDNQKYTFNILILRFNRMEGDKNSEIKWEEAIVEGLTKMNNSEIGNIQIVYDCASKYDVLDSNRIEKIANYKNADLIIYGNYYENSKRTDILYKLNSRHNYIQVTSGYMDNKSVNSLADIRQGYLLNNVNHIVNWIFGIKSYIQSNFIKAIQYIEKIETDDKQFTIEQYLFLGDLYYMLGMHEEEIKCYDIVEQLNNKVPKLYLNRGSAYMLLSDTLKGMSDYYKSYSLDSTYSLVNYNLARNLFFHGKIDSALIYVDKALQSKANDIEARQLRARIYLFQNDTLRGNEELNLCIKISPTNKLNVYSYFNIGSYFYLRNQFDIALQNFKMAENLGYNNEFMFSLMSFCYLKLGNQRSSDYYARKSPSYPKIVPRY